MGAFETFVNANLGIRKPLILDSGPPSLSQKAAGIVGSEYIDLDDNSIYEKTGENNSVDWKFIRKLGSSNEQLVNISGDFYQELNEINQELIQVSGSLRQEISSISDNVVASKVDLPTGVGDISLKYHDIHHSLNFNATPHVFVNLTSNSGCPAFYAYSTYEVNQSGFKVAFSDIIRKEHQALELLIIESTFGSNTLLSQEINFPEMGTGYVSSGTYDLNASTTSQLDISYSLDQTGAAGLSGNALILNYGGEVNITASQTGNELYDAADDVTRSLTIIDDTICDHVTLHIQSDTNDESDPIVDSSPLTGQVYQSGDVGHATEPSLFSTSSIEFDGDGDWLYIDSQDELTGDFTAEAWFNIKNIPAASGFNLSSDTSVSLLEDDVLEITGDMALSYVNDRVSSIGSNTITLTNLSGVNFEEDQRLLLISTYGPSGSTVGNYEFVETSTINQNTITLKSNIQKDYDVDNYTFIVAPKRYNKIIVEENVSVSSEAWSDSSSSIQGLVLLSANEILIKGNVSANSLGFRGGNIGNASSPKGGRGESYIPGVWNVQSKSQAYGAGGGGKYTSLSSNDGGTSGAGGGHGSAGTNGSGDEAKAGEAFASINNTIKQKVFMGPGGGQGASDNASPFDNSSSRGGYGGRGGGIVIIDSINCQVTASASITANGQQGFEAHDPGDAEPGNGGGGAGGSILFMGNLNNEGLIETKYGDRRVADGSGQSSGYGYTSGYGGNGVIAWFGYQVGNKPDHCLDHYLWKNSSFIFSGGATTQTSTGGSSIAINAVSKNSSEYQITYGSIGDNVLVDNNLSFNNWYHIAMVRKNGTETLYLNGSSVSTRQNSATYQNNAYSVGGQALDNFVSPLPMNGNLQDLRVTQKALYHNNFTTPTSLLKICNN
jgi:hypothetical protein